MKASNIANSLTVIFIFSLAGFVAAGAAAPIWLKVYWLLDGEDNNGWLMNTSYGRSDNGILRNASNANMAMGAHLAEHAIYTLGLKDSDGNTLTGEGIYRITLNKPPLKEHGFWSITSYDGDFPLPLVDNALDKYAINSGNQQQLTPRDDGRLSFIYSAKKPEGTRDEDWLPAHDKNPLPIFRAYNPQPPIVDGSWEMPTIERINQGEAQ